MHISLLFSSQNIKVRIPARAFLQVYCSITLSHLLDISSMTRFGLFPLQRHINFLPVSRANMEHCSIIAFWGCKSNPGWGSLQSRRNTHKLLLFYKKKVHGIAPNWLSERMPPLVQETTTYCLRNSDNVRNYRARTNKIRVIQSNLENLKSGRLEICLIQAIR